MSKETLTSGLPRAKPYDINLWRPSPSHTIIAILLLNLVDHGLDSRVIWLDLIQVVPRTLIFRLLLKVLTHLDDFIDQVCLLEGGALLEQRYQYLLDQPRAVGPLVVVARVVLVHSMAEGQLLAKDLLHESQS